RVATCGARPIRPRRPPGAADAADLPAPHRLARSGNAAADGDRDHPARGAVQRRPRPRPRAARSGGRRPPACESAARRSPPGRGAAARLRAEGRRCHAGLTVGSFPGVTHADAVDLAAARASYSEAGYWLTPVLFDAGEVDRFREATARVVAGDYRGDRVPTLS